ncbi:hypothetical protein KCP75_25605 [Salmonella enterica subsp. enterica]|nr:hypothetical protein KCP75_25605 [Salmonella enterica subsp. enterica]
MTPHLCAILPESPIFAVRCHCREESEANKPSPVHICDWSRVNSTLSPRKDIVSEKCPQASTVQVEQSGLRSLPSAAASADPLLRQKSFSDFDVTTNATPDQVRKLFRNCRPGVVSALAHVMFGPKLSKWQRFVLTAKAVKTVAPTSQRAAKRSMLLQRIISSASIEEDAQRRDFTINVSLLQRK